MRFGLRELIFFAVLLAVPVASFVYVFKPRNAEIKVAQAEIDVKQAKLTQLEEITRQIDDIGLEIEKGAESIAQIEAKLPSEQLVEGILEQVWQIAKKNGMVVKKVESDKHVPAAQYMEQPLKMQLEGEFDGYYQFLLELEKLDRITRIKKMKLDRVTGGGSPGRDGSAAANAQGSMKAEFTLSIYYESQARTAQ
jgi:type IV pilus assembly protein PilO